MDISVGSYPPPPPVKAHIWERNQYLTSPPPLTCSPPVKDQTQLPLLEASGVPSPRKFLDPAQFGPLSGCNGQ